ncbi:MAG: type II toxin-antitoxin system RelE/ParE family toxin [Clostridia bacterium]|nr:type II toxin-antitoxin system RelE/ParE family toxin [Clostridia bacterium]
MEYKLDISETAQKDLDEILTYITETLFAPDAAARFADEVETCYLRLQANPFIYAISHMPQLAKKGFRRAPVKNHLILYKIDEAKQIVYITRIFYGARNYTALV